RCAQGFPGFEPAGPADAANPVRVQPDDGHVALPSTAAAGEIEAHMAQLQAAYFHSELSDFANRNVVARSHVVGVKSAVCCCCGHQNRIDHIADMDIGLTLRSIA